MICGSHDPDHEISVWWDGMPRNLLHIYQFPPKHQYISNTPCNNMPRDSNLHQSTVFKSAKYEPNSHFSVAAIPLKHRSWYSGQWIKLCVCIN